jgi:hypothetical protein
MEWYYSLVGMIGKTSQLVMLNRSLGVDPKKQIAETLIRLMKMRAPKACNCLEEVAITFHDEFHDLAGIESNIIQLEFKRNCISLIRH